MAEHRNIIDITVRLDLSDAAANSLTKRTIEEIWDKLLDNVSFVTGKHEKLKSVKVKKIGESGQLPLSLK